MPAIHPARRRSIDKLLIILLTMTLSVAIGAAAFVDINVTPTSTGFKMQPHAAAGPAFPAATGPTARHGFDAPAAATLAPITVAPRAAGAASDARTATPITGPAPAPCADAALPLGSLAQPALRAC